MSTAAIIQEAESVVYESEDHGFCQIKYDQVCLAECPRSHQVTSRIHMFSLKDIPHLIESDWRDITCRIALILLTT